MAKKRFFEQHAKSSAAMISLGIHAVLIVVALSFVAVTVITKEEQVFEAKPVKRPKMALKKLQVPINIKKKKMQKPKLRKRIVVQPKLNKTMPDIKMPEITGVKGGLGGGIAGGLGGAGGVGFSMPEINLFGIKGKGEKIFIILDTSAGIMSDELGGIPAYTIIKQELVRIVAGLPPTALFNVAVYDRHRALALFPKLVSASAANTAKCKAWLEPLNDWREGMGAKEYGPRTVGPGGVPLGGKVVREPLKTAPEWVLPALHAMNQQADAIFILAAGWGRQYYRIETGPVQVDPAMARKYAEYCKKAQKLHDEENERRMKRGEPPRVLDGQHTIVRTYFPNMRWPSSGHKNHHYTPEEITASLKNIRSETKTVPSSSGLSRKKGRDRFALNVINFTPARGAVRSEPFYKLTSLANGEYQMIKGMDAIESYVGSETEK
jgi:hypothetical protein